MTPQERINSQRCYPLPTMIFESLEAAMQPQHRFRDEQITCPHVLLMEAGHHMACFYDEGA